LSESSSKPHTSAGFPTFVPPQSKLSSFRIKYALLLAWISRWRKAWSTGLVAITVIAAAIGSVAIMMTIAGIAWQVYVPVILMVSVSMGLSSVITIGEKLK
jgi:hypothetical protein